MNNEQHILACVSRSRLAEHIVDYAAWAAQRLAAPLELLHLIEHHTGHGAGSDRSGAIGVDAQEQLLSKLTADDEQSARLLREGAREYLQRLRQRALAAGAERVDGRLRQGEISATLAEVSSAARLVVVGRHAAAAADKDSGGDIQAMVRAARAPVLAVPGPFRPPERVLLAFDGGAASRRSVQMMAASALFQGLQIEILMSGADTAAASRALQDAQGQLQAARLQVEARLVQGELPELIGAALAQRSIDLLVMGSYSHSPLRSLLKGSTTTQLLRAFPIPTLLMR